MILAIFFLWTCFLVVYLFTSSLDAYFYPGFIAKRVHVPSQAFFILSMWMYYLLVVVLAARKFSSGKLPTVHRGVLIVFSLIWSAYLPLSWFIEELREIVLRHNDREIIYTAYYHLNYDQIEKTFLSVKKLVESSVLYLLLLPNWGKMYMFVKAKTAPIRVWTARKMKYLLRKASLRGIVNFFEDWLTFFPALFFLIIVINILINRLAPQIAFLTARMSSVALYLAALSVVLFVLMRDHLELKKENKYLNILLVTCLIILVSVLFADLGLISQILMVAFIMLIAFVFYS